MLYLSHSQWYIGELMTHFNKFMWNKFVSFSLVLLSALLHNNKIIYRHIMIILLVCGIFTCIFPKTATQKIWLVWYSTGHYSKVFLWIREFPCFGLASWRYNRRICNTVWTPTLSLQFYWVNDPESIISFTLKCYKNLLAQEVLNRVKCYLQDGS